MDLQVGFGATPDDIVTVNQNVRITAHPTSVSGRPASLDGPLQVSVIAGNGTFAPGNSNNDALLVSEGQPGDTVYEIDGDADPSAGIELIKDTVTVRVSVEKAAALGLSVSIEPK